MRRTTLLGLLLSLFACGAEPAPRHEPLAGWADEVALAEPPDLDPDPRVLEVNLVASEQRIALYDGLAPKLWTYGTSLPGPLLHARVGDTLRVHFENRLPEATTIHWHGLEVPAAMDGSEESQAPVGPGERFDYEFVLERAGTYWYHPHKNSSAQLWRGLYGAILVDDPAAPPLGHETVLVLDDVSVGEDGEVTSPDENGNLGDYFGREGDHLLVNGRVMPTLHARRGDALRLHVVNVANSRFFDLAVEGHELVRVGGDGGLIARPEHTDHVLLAPGERADIVITPKGDVGTKLTVRSRAYSRFHCVPSCGEERALMTIEIAEGEGYAPPLPELLAAIEPVALSGAHAETIELTEGADGGSAVLGLNGHRFDSDPLVLEAATDSTLLWSIVNTTEYDHPFHLHGFRFQVLDRDGVAPAVREWKDTLNVPALTSARIAVPIDEREGMWMFHCHILDHVKLGMMGMLHVAKAHAHGAHQARGTTGRERQDGVASSW